MRARVKVRVRAEAEVEAGAGAGAGARAEAGPRPRNFGLGDVGPRVALRAGRLNGDLLYRVGGIMMAERAGAKWRAITK